MTNFTVLPNLPKDFYDLSLHILQLPHLVDVCDTNPNKNKLEALERFKPVGDEYFLAFKEKLPESIKDYFSDYELMISPPGTSLFFHIDPSRLSGINIPLQVDLGRGDLLVSKPNHNLKITGEYPNNDRYGSITYEKDLDQMDRYNMENPILLNVRAPHSFEHKSSKERIIMTLDFQLSYSEMLEALPKEWF